MIWKQRDERAHILTDVLGSNEKKCKNEERRDATPPHTIMKKEKSIADTRKEEEDPTSQLERELELLAIKATSQESRFHTEATTNLSKEIDLKDVNLFVGKKQLLQDAHLRLKEGVHYGLIGRNGVGKSTLLRALSDHLIPGLATNLNILLVSQLDSEMILDVLIKDKEEVVTVMDAVLQSDKQRVNLEKQVLELGKVLEKQEEKELHEVVSRILLEKAFEVLENARKISSKRSGTRGSIARKDLLEAEKMFEKAKKE